MNLPKGVFIARKKDNSIYYRVSITYHAKHISLGSFETPEAASKCFVTARRLLDGHATVADFEEDGQLAFDKWVILVNFRDNNMYFKTPIYLYKKYFLYYLTKECPLKFDVDDLFYYSTHKIMTRNGYFFVADYGMQVNILSRYGIRNHAVAGRDYVFVNGDSSDYTYGNIQIINPYFGVQRITKNGHTKFCAKIHINGDYIIGYYDNEETAAIAYNKAAAILKSKGVRKNFPENYIENISAIDYAKIYNNVRISNKIREY